MNPTELEKYATARAREAVESLRQNRRQERRESKLEEFNKAVLAIERQTHHHSDFSIELCDLLFYRILDLEERLDEIEWPRSK